MLTLAIDTSSRTISVAFLEDEVTRLELFLNTGLYHSSLLVPAIKSSCELLKVNIEQIDLMVCTSGPGSFTGLRIGMSAIKGFALANHKPIMGVSSLEALAMNLSDTPAIICPVIDAAQKDLIYTALFTAGEGGLLKRIGKDKLTDMKSLLREIPENTIFLGNGAIKYADTIRKTLPKNTFSISFQNHLIKASNVGLIGLRMFMEGKADDLLLLKPRYLCLSEGEMKSNA
jgi:tRNA threonylcarbamoyladenosine biosynthesis protein TsaB